ASPRSVLLPYTTLFRSAAEPASLAAGARGAAAGDRGGEPRPPLQGLRRYSGALRGLRGGGAMGVRPAAGRACRARGPAPAASVRSEEHTSELQSREKLV